MSGPGPFSLRSPRTSFALLGSGCFHSTGSGPLRATQVQFPVLAQEPFAEVIMGLLLHEPIPFSLVKAPGRIQSAVGPEPECLEAGSAGEARAPSNQAASNSHAPEPGFHQEEPEQGNAGPVPIAHDSHRPGSPVTLMGDPDPVQGRIESPDQLLDHPGHQGFKAGAPSHLLVIDHPVTVDDPAQIAGARGTETNPASGDIFSPRG